MGKTIGGLAAVIIGILFFVNIILTGLLALTYSSLTEEEKVAVIKFDNIPDQPGVYIAHLYDNEESKIDDYTIYGDQWRIDASFIKVKNWANLLKIKSKYRLNRFEGRYKNIDHENSKKHKAYQLESHSLIDTFPFFVDTTYGSSVYQDIKVNTKYTVLKSITGLMVREEPIEIKKKKSFWEKTKSFFD